MWHSSEARRSFAFEALGNKLVTDLAGISEAIGIRLKNDGFDKVNCIACQLLILFGLTNNTNYDHRMPRKIISCKVAS